MGPIMGIYWTLIVFIYLAVSFLTESWGTTWIIWPLAGVASSVIGAIAAEVWKRKLENNRSAG